MYFTINNVTLEEVNGGEIYTINQHSSLNKYRFGFNGAENLNEVKGYGNTPDLGDRWHDPRIARINYKTDKRTADYPWQSPYAYYRNSPIAIIDFNGEGGTEDNPKDPTHQNGITTGKTAKRIFKSSGGIENYKETIKKIKLEKVDIDAKMAAATASGNLASDSETKKDAEKYNTYSNADIPFYRITNEAEFSEKDIVNYLLGNYIYGTGKENIYFDENSKFSKSFATSFSFNQGALLTRLNRQEDLEKEYFKYGFSQQGRDVLDNFSFLSASNFVGSYSVTTKTTATHIEFYIYNVTSVSSGSFGKHFPDVHTFNIGLTTSMTFFSKGTSPKSTVRHKDKITPYGNISQMIKIIIPIIKQ